MKPNPPGKIHHLLAGGLALAAIGTPPARAVDYTWTGTAGTFLWSDMTKWTNSPGAGGPNGAANKAIVEVGGSVANITTGDNITIGTLQLRSTAGVLVDGTGHLAVNSFSSATAGGFSVTWTGNSTGSFAGPIASAVSSNMHIRGNSVVTATGTVNIAATGNGNLNLIENGSLNKTSNSALFISTSTSNSAGTTNGILTLANTASLTLNNGTQTVNLYSPTATVGTSNRTLVSTVNLNGGTLYTAGFVRGGVNATTGNAVINLNGGEIKLGANSAALFSGFANTNTANSNLNVLSGGMKLNTNGFNAGVAQNLSGAGGLTKTGTGTLTLTGVTAFTGATSIQDGTLALGGAGTLGGTTAIAIRSGATLGLSGITGSTYTVSADVTGAGTIDATGKTVQFDGDFNPGDNPQGIFSVTGDLALNGVTTLDIASLAGEGTGHDKVNVSNTLAYGGDLVLAFSNPLGSGTLNLFDSLARTGSFAGVTVQGYGDDVVLAENAGIWTGTSAGGTGFSFDQATGELTLVPEPSTCFVAALGGVLLTARRRKTR